MPTETLIVLTGVFVAFAFFASVVLFADTTSREK